MRRWEHNNKTNLIQFGEFCDCVLNSSGNSVLRVENVDVIVLKPHFISWACGIEKPRVYETKHRGWRGIALCEIQAVVYHNKLYLRRMFLKRMIMKMFQME